MTARACLRWVPVVWLVGCAAVRPAPLTPTCQDAQDRCLARCRPSSGPQAGAQASPLESSGLRAHHDDGTRPAVETAPCDADCHRDARLCQ